MQSTSLQRTTRRLSLAGVNQLKRVSECWPTVVASLVVLVGGCVQLRDTNLTCCAYPNGCRALCHLRDDCCGIVPRRGRDRVATETA
jgi:hypothetical protein